MSKTSKMVEKPITGPSLSNNRNNIKEAILASYEHSICWYKGSRLIMDGQEVMRFDDDDIDHEEE